MREQYVILSELKKLEDKTFRMQVELERIPREIETLTAQLKEKEEEYKKVKAVLDEAEKKHREAELDLKERDEGLKKAESKLMEVKTNEEYQAGMKELENQKKEKNKLEEGLVASLSQVEEKKKATNAAEATYKEWQAKFNTDKKALDDERQKLAVHYEELAAKTTATKKGLQPSILSTYDRMVGRMDGQVIALAMRGLCEGCNVKIQPQVYNEMLGFKAVHRCNSCGRILIVETEAKPA